MGGASPLQGRLEATVSQEQLRDPVRARGEEAGGVLQHLTRVNPRKADLIKVSVPVNATPSIHPRSEWILGVALTGDRKSTRLNSSHDQISYAVFCLKKKTKIEYYE